MAEQQEQRCAGVASHSVMTPACSFLPNALFRSDIDSLKSIMVGVLTIGRLARIVFPENWFTSIPEPRRTYVKFFTTFL